MTRVGSGHDRWFGRSWAGGPSSGPRRSATVRGLDTCRPLRLGRRRSRRGPGRALRSLSDRPFGGRGTAGIRNPRRRLGQRWPTGAQQQAQRDQNTGRSQDPPVSHGNTSHATSTFSGMKKPVVTLHNPQRRHTLQGPADHPACSWWSGPPPLPIITGPPESAVNSPRARRRIPVPDTSISSHIRIQMGQGHGRPGFRPGSRATRRCVCDVCLLSWLPLFSGGPTRHAGIVA